MDEETLFDIVRSCASQSDIGLDQMIAYARLFIEAHTRAPGGLSIEVGTRDGGSALMWLKLLHEIYGEDPPCVFTVDPYGGKAYGGYHDYDDAQYLLAKGALARYPNHAHFLLRSVDFFAPMAHRPYWRHRIEHTIDNFTFVFLDGDHSCKTISEEVEALLGPDRLLAVGGSIVIDNADHDGGVWPMLKGYDGQRVDEVISHMTGKQRDDRGQGALIR